MENDPQAAEVVRFGVFEADLRTGELRKNGHLVRLQEQPFQILVMLLERPGRVVTHDELRQKLWSGATFVDFDHGIRTAINKTRLALGDSADNPRFVETLPRRGYRFIAPVEPVINRPSHQGIGEQEVDMGRPAGPAQGFPVSPPAAAPPSQIAITHAGMVREPTWRRPWVFALSAGALAALVGILFGLNVAGLRDRVGPRGVAPAPGSLQGAPLPKIESIVVLPLENLSRDAEQEYFAGGMTEALITNLGEIQALRVISRTTAMHFKGTKRTLPEIARELNVDAAIEGSVLCSGNRVRVTAKLLHAPTDRHLWANTYERDLSDVLALQGELARAIAEEVRIKLTPQERARLASARPVNPEVNEVYLRGRYYRSLFPEGLERAVECFQKATKNDPNYAEAYAGLGLTYSFLGFFQSPRDIFPRARVAALRAMELDETLAEGHTASGFVKLYFDWDWQGAEAAWRRALRLNPNSVDALQLSAEHLVFTGQFEEGLAQDRRARDLDPLNMFVADTLGYHLMRSRRYDDAIAHYQRMLELDASLVAARIHLAWVYTLKGMHAEALAEWKKLGEPPDDPFLGFLYAEMGRREDAQRVADNARRASARHYFDAYCMAISYVGLGDKSQAFAWLEKAYQDRSTFMAQLKVDAFFDPLRSDPCFQDLLRRMNFPKPRSTP